MSTVLFTDAGGPVDGRMIIGVCHEDGELVRWDRLEADGGNVRRLEIRAILLAARYAAAARDGLVALGPAPQPRFTDGVILTDCQDAVASLGKGGPRPPRAYKRSEYRDLIDEVVAVLPMYWRVAWVPRSLNIANAALRRMPTDPERRVDE